jgi:hypothetical protein
MIAQRMETSWSILLLVVFFGFSLFAAKAFSPLPLALQWRALCVPEKRGWESNPRCQNCLHGKQYRAQKASAQTEEKSTYSMRP